MLFVPYHNAILYEILTLGAQSEEKYKQQEQG